MQIPGRKFNSGNYKYGFNGMENDNEIKGNGNSVDFGARMYDPRLGRWSKVDPLANLQPDQSTYKFGLNNPNVFIDPDGNTEVIYTYEYDRRTGKTTIRISTSARLMTDGKKHTVWGLGNSGSYSLINKYYDYQTIRHTYVGKDGRTYENTNVPVRHTIMYEGGAEDYENVWFGGDKYGDTKLDDIRFALYGSGTGGVEVWNSNKGGTVVADIDPNDPFWGAFFGAMQKSRTLQSAKGSDWSENLQNGVASLSEVIKTIVGADWDDADDDKDDEGAERYSCRTCNRTGMTASDTTDHDNDINRRPSGKRNYIPASVKNKGKGRGEDIEKGEWDN